MRTHGWLCLRLGFQRVATTTFLTLLCQLDLHGHELVFFVGEHEQPCELITEHDHVTVIAVHTVINQRTLAHVLFLDLGLFIANNVHIKDFCAIKALFQLFDRLKLRRWLMHVIVVVEQLADNFELLCIDRANLIFSFEEGTTRCRALRQLSVGGLSCV